MKARIPPPPLSTSSSRSNHCCTDESPSSQKHSLAPLQLMSANGCNAFSPLTSDSDYEDAYYDCEVGACSPTALDHTGTLEDVCYNNNNSNNDNNTNNNNDNNNTIIYNRTNKQIQDASGDNNKGDGPTSNPTSCPNQNASPTELHEHYMQSFENGGGRDAGDQLLNLPALERPRCPPLPSALSLRSPSPPPDVNFSSLSSSSVLLPRNGTNRMAHRSAKDAQLAKLAMGNRRLPPISGGVGSSEGETKSPTPPMRHSSVDGDPATTATNSARSSLSNTRQYKYLKLKKMKRTKDGKRKPSRSVSPTRGKHGSTMDDDQGVLSVAERRRSIVKPLDVEALQEKPPA